jgi:hypothetical protein
MGNGLVWGDMWRSKSGRSQRLRRNNIAILILLSIARFLENHNAAITALFTVVLAVSTILLWRSTDKLWAAAIQQGADMETSIAHASRSAAAMETVAANIEANSEISLEHLSAGKENAARQMRAYLGVGIGHAIYQETSNSKRFEALPTLANYDFTPAHNVSYWAAARILPFPLPDDFDFSQATEISEFNFTLHPRQELILNAFVDELVDDSDVADIKRGDTRRLTVYGTVFYEDALGIPRRTNFCHSTRWIPTPDGNERVIGNFARYHNDAD